MPDGFVCCGGHEGRRRGPHQQQHLQRPEGHQPAATEPQDIRHSGRYITADSRG